MTDNDDTKNKILNTAIKLFAEDGLEQASVRKICNRAQLAISAITYHFGSKENLGSACIKHCFKLLNDELAEIGGDKNLSAKKYALSFAATMERYPNEVRLIFHFFNAGKLKDIPDSTLLRDTFTQGIHERLQGELDDDTVRAEAFFLAIFQDQLARLFQLKRLDDKRTKWLEKLATILFGY